MGRGPPSSIRWDRNVKQQLRLDTLRAWVCPHILSIAVGHVPASGVWSRGSDFLLLGQGGACGAAAADV
jgi:hypothetical protein